MTRFGAPVTVHIAEAAAGLDAVVLDRRHDLDAAAEAHGAALTTGSTAYTSTPTGRSRSRRSCPASSGCCPTRCRRRARGVRGPLPERALYAQLAGRRPTTRPDRLVRRAARRHAARDAAGRRVAAAIVRAFHPAAPDASTACRPSTAPATSARRRARSSSSRRSVRPACPRALPRWAWGLYDVAARPAARGRRRRRSSRLRGTGAGPPGARTVPPQGLAIRSRVMKGGLVIILAVLACRSVDGAGEHGAPAARHR